MAVRAGGDRAEAQIRRQIVGWAAAFRAKDVDGVMAYYAPDVVSFDIVPPLQYVGTAAYRRAWEEGLAPFPPMRSVLQTMPSRLPVEPSMLPPSLRP